MSREAFWIAVSTAAPVIALAAVVAYSDTMDRLLELTAWHAEGPPLPWNQWHRPEHRAASRVLTARKVCLANIIVQALALALALTSLATRGFEVPPAVAIAAEVAGVGSLTFAAVASSKSRYSMLALQLARAETRGEKEAAATPPEDRGGNETPP